MRRRLWQLLPIDWGRVAEFTNEPVPAHIKRWWFALGGTPAPLGGDYHPSLQYRIFA